MQLIRLRYCRDPHADQVSYQDLRDIGNEHVDIGRGKTNWDVFRFAPAPVGFDGIMTSFVFAWEAHADESGRYMREMMQKCVDEYGGRAKG